LAAARKIWRYRLFTLPIIALGLAGSFYVFAVMSPNYEAGATYILVNPPPPPTPDQIARDPELEHVNADNPYLRFSGQTVLVQVLASRLSSSEGRKRLAAKGADPDYVAAPSPNFGLGAPILEITGTGASPAAAIRSTHLVGAAIAEELDRMQEVRRVAKPYRIRAETAVPANHARLKAAGKLSTLAAVFALGTILMFIVISVLDAIDEVRRDPARNQERAEWPLQAQP
jgi:hypothetical protein